MMNPELLGMSNEELIQRACERSGMGKRVMGRILSDIEVFCASHPIGVSTFVEEFVVFKCSGLLIPEAFARITRKYS